MILYRRRQQVAEEVPDQQVVQRVVAAGLAADLMARGKPELNLMPQTYYLKQQAWNVVKIGAIILAIVGAIFYYQIKQLDSQIAAKNKELADARTEEAKYKGDAEQFDKTKSEIITNMPKFDQVFNLVKSQPVWPGYMAELGAVTPDSVFLTEVTFNSDDHSIGLKGVATSRFDLMLYCLSIDHSDFFSQVMCLRGGCLARCEYRRTRRNNGCNSSFVQFIQLAWSK